MSDVITDVRDLKKYYEGGLIRALNGVSFAVASGEIVSFMGPSGCGKSTLFNLLGTIDVVYSGDIRFRGKNVRDYRPLDRFRARHIGFIFQFHNLIPTMTLVENVEAPMTSLSVPRQERRERAMTLLEEMGLAGRRDAFPSRLSGGERQRVAIARALVNDPALVLADEPTGSLDSETSERVMHFLLDRCRKQGTTLLIATHNHDLASRTNRTLLMKDGIIA